MTSKRIQLRHGVWLNMVQTDRFKTGCFSINLLQPLAEHTASVYALLPSVLLRGCSEYPNIQTISCRLDVLYGATVGAQVRKKGEVHAIGLYADFLEDCYADDEPVFAQMMDFLRQLLFEPCMEGDGFVKSYVDGEKQNLLNTIASRINDKRSYAVNRLLKHMCAGEAYGVTRLGEKEALEHVDHVSLYTVWQYLLKTSAIELFYLGQKSETEVIEQMKKLLSHLPEREKLCHPETLVVLPNRPVQTVEESMDVTQGKLSIGFRTSITGQDEKYPALLLMNSVFGAGMTSKLFMKIREEQSLCYYASSSLDKFKGILAVTSGIEFEKYEVAKQGILQQLDDCKKGEITEEELESARNYLVSGLRACNDNPGQMDDYVIGQAVAGSQKTVDDLISALEGVTMQQVIDAANSVTLDTIYFLKGVQ